MVLKPQQPSPTTAIALQYLHMEVSDLERKGFKKIIINGII